MTTAASSPPAATPAPPPPPTAAGATTIVVVDASSVQRRLLRAAVEAEHDLAVVGEARTGDEAVALVARLRPAAVLLRLDLPADAGLEAVERIMSASPTPILVLGAGLTCPTSDAAKQVLAAGAVDVLGSAEPDGDQAYALVLRGKLRVASRVRVITHPRGRLRSQGLAALPGAERLEPPAGPEAGEQAPQEARTHVRLVAVGASTGGPQALRTLLEGLPGDLSQAVLVVQHMSPGFIPGLAAWLDGLIPLPVVVGGSGRRLVPGTVTIAPSGGNLLVQDDRLRVLCVPPDAGQFHVPGIDATFTSVARALGPAAVGVLLTGMGRDGAAGLLAMREQGAVTLGQDEATSTVYGMPAAAAALGAVVHQLPLPGIAAAVLTAVGREQ